MASTVGTVFLSERLCGPNLVRGQSPQDAHTSSYGQKEEDRAGRPVFCVASAGCGFTHSTQFVPDVLKAKFGRRREPTNLAP